MGKEMDALHDFEQKIMEVKEFYIEFFKKTLVMNGKGIDPDFTISEIKALAAFRGGRDFTMGELSKNAQVAMPSMTEMIDKLVRHGMAKRSRDENDRRVVKVSLTEKGKRLRKAFMQKRFNDLKATFGTLSPAELDELISSLRKARLILEKVEVTHA